MRGGPFDQEEATEGEEGKEGEYIRGGEKKAGPGDETLAREAKPRTNELN